MLSHHVAEMEILRWRAMTPEEKIDVQNSLIFMREALPTVAPMPGIWGFALTQTRTYAGKIAVDLVAIDALPIIELAFINSLLTPVMLGWVHTCKHLMNALDDPRVQENAVAVSLLTTILIEAQGAVQDTGKSWFLFDERTKAIKSAISERAKKHAEGKNRTPRAWLIVEWSRRTDKAQSKASFARQYAPLVKRKFDLIVTSETIARDWLPKTQK